MPIDRILPQNIESEQALIGGIFIAYDKYINTLVLYLPIDAFYREAHGHIYKAMLDLYNQDNPITLETVANTLKKQDLLEKAGGIDYLMQLSTITATTAAWEYHYKEILNTYKKRQTILICQKTAEALFQPFMSNEEALETLDTHVINTYSVSKKTNLTHIGDDIPAAFKELERVSTCDNFITGLDTGFIDMNRYLAGLQPSDLIILAARPSMGKSALALNIVYNAAKKGKTSAIFNLEMSKNQTIFRLVSADSGIDSKKIKTGQLRDSDWSQLTHSAGILTDLPIYQDDSLSINITEMRSKLKYLTKKVKLDLVVIDYLQLMSGSKSENRQIEISEYSRAFKGMAKDFNVPVLCLSQLSRKLEERGNKRPLMSDLRESGAIEQDADVILFIYRDEVYYGVTDENKNIAEIIVAKHRNGETGMFKMIFMKEYTLFRNYTTTEIDDPEAWYNK